MSKYDFLGDRGLLVSIDAEFKSRQAELRLQQPDSGLDSKRLENVVSILEDFTDSSVIRFVDRAVDSHAAVQMIEVNQYDFVLPVLSALGGNQHWIDALMQIRSVRPDVPMVVITPMIDESTVLAILKCGVEDFVDAENLSPALLAKSIRYSIQRSALIRERIELQKLVLETGRRERQRISSDLHDSIGQQLTGLNMLARSLCRRLAGKQIPESESAKQIADGIQESLGQIRSIIGGLMPVPVEAGGLRASLDQLCQQTQQRTSIECRLDCPTETLFDDNRVATQVFRIAQESVNNAVKHGKAGQILIRFERRPENSVLQVVDDGCGFSIGKSASHGHGLRIMKHRAELIGANLQVYSNPGSGTVVHCSLPHPTKNG